jgi:hypothetical protein
MAEKRTVTFCIVESPYAPFTKGDPERAAVELARNEAYVSACLADSFARGETPFGSHAIYTRNLHGVKVLDDTIPAERKKGMQAGFDVATALGLLAAADETANPIIRDLLDGVRVKFVRAFYLDRGWTNGMADGMLEAGKNDQRFEKRTLDKTGPVGYWSREADKDWAITSDGALYQWRVPEPVVEGSATKAV